MARTLSLETHGTCSWLFQRAAGHTHRNSSRDCSTHKRIVKHQAPSIQQLVPMCRSTSSSAYMHTVCRGNVGNSMSKWKLNKTNSPHLHTAFGSLPTRKPPDARQYSCDIVWIAHSAALRCPINRSLALVKSHAKYTCRGAKHRPGSRSEFFMRSGRLLEDYMVLR
jgi:hypothetical protein